MENFIFCTMIHLLRQVNRRTGRQTDRQTRDEDTEPLTDVHTSYKFTFIFQWNIIDMGKYY